MGPGAGSGLRGAAELQLSCGPCPAGRKPAVTTWLKHQQAELVAFTSMCAAAAHPLCQGRAVERHALGASRARRLHLGGHTPWVALPGCRAHRAAPAQPSQPSLLNPRPQLPTLIPQTTKIPNRHHHPANRQVTFKNLRFMNGNSKMGFGGAVEVFGPVDVTFINCEFGGSISELPRLASVLLWLKKKSSSTASLAAPSVSSHACLCAVLMSLMRM